IELCLNIDARRSRKRKAMSNVDVSFGRRCERWGLRVEGSRTARFYRGASDFTDTLPQFQLTEHLRFGHPRVSLQRKRVNGVAPRVAGRNLPRGSHLKSIFGKSRWERKGPRRLRGRWRQ